MKKNILYAQSLFFILLLSTSILACTCVEYNTPVCAMISRSDAVFTGKVEKITPFTEKESDGVRLGNVGSISTIGDNNLIWLHIKVDRKFKGINEDFVKVLTYTNTSCDLEVKKGERWIFYANQDKNGNFNVGACSGTNKISNDDKDYLENVYSISQDKNSQSINGFVKADHYDYEGIKNVLINVEGKDFFSTTTTGKEGSFKIKVPQTGKYSVTITVPFAGMLYSPYALEDAQVKLLEPTETKSGLIYEINVPQGQCHYTELEFLPIDLKATGEINGKFVSTDSKLFPKFYPQLCPLKESEIETLKSCRTNWELKEDGSFSFRGLREGKFVIVVNRNNFPEVATPFLKQYYPGVKDFKDAQIIDLEQGQKLDGLTFKLPPALPSRKISGKIFWKNKSPAFFTDESSWEEKPKVYLYNPNNASSSISDNFYKFLSKDTDKTETIKTIEVNPDGSFSAIVFDGFEYVIQASIYDKKEKYYCALEKITVDDRLASLNLILNRTKNCKVEDYLKELKIK